MISKYNIQYLSQIQKIKILQSSKKILSTKCPTYSVNTVVKLLYKKFVILTKYSQKDLLTISSISNKQQKNNKKTMKSDRYIQIQLLDEDNTIIEVQNSKQSYKKHRYQQKRNSKIRQRNQNLLINSLQEKNISFIEIQDTEEQNPIDFKSKITSKLIDEQTNRKVHLLNDHFTPKNYAQQLSKDYINFRNTNFSTQMPAYIPIEKQLKRTQQLASQNIENGQSHINPKRFLPNVGEILHKNQERPQYSYVFLSESDISKDSQEEFIKKIHEQRQIAERFIQDKYGIRYIREKLDPSDLKEYHRVAKRIIRKGYQCLQQFLIQKYKKPIRTFPYKQFKNLSGFLLDFKDSFKDEQKVDTFINYIRLAYRLPCPDPPDCQESLSLYKFIMRILVPEDQYEKIATIN